MSGSEGGWAEQMLGDGLFAALDAEQQARREAAHADTARRLYLESLNEVLKTPQGMEVVLRFLEILGYGAPVWQPSAAIHRQAALRDAADELFGDIAAASPVAHDTIMRTLHLRRAAATNQTKEKR